MRAQTCEDFQRGTPLVAPAQLLPFQGPEGHSPGRHLRGPLGLGLLGLGFGAFRALGFGLLGLGCRV